MTKWQVTLLEDTYPDNVVTGRVFTIEVDEIVVLPNGFFCFQRKNTGNGQAPTNVLILSHEAVQFMHPEAKDIS